MTSRRNTRPEGPVFQGAFSPGHREPLRVQAAHRLEGVAHALQDEFSGGVRDGEPGNMAGGAQLRVVSGAVALAGVGVRG